MKRAIMIAGLILVLAFFGWQVFQRTGDRGTQTAQQRPQAPVAVETVAVEQTLIRDIGEFSGSLYPLSEFVLAPKIGGRLESILVNIGDQVSGGQLVAVLDDEEYRQQVSQSRAELEVARALLQEVQSLQDKVRRDYERTVELSRRKIASEAQRDAAEAEFETQKAKLKVAIAQVAQKDAALRIAEVRLQYTQIQVPQNHGAIRVIGERFVDEGALLAPNTPIASILNITRLNAVIHVIERDYAKIRPGLDAEISTDAFPGQTFSGRVARIAPLLKENSRQARVEIDIPNDRMLLKPGMFVRVRLTFAVHENATVAPTAAVVTRNGVQGVFTVDRQTRKAVFVPVTIGISSGAQVEIVTPPLSGEVVTLGTQLLQDGADILIPDRVEPAVGSPQGALRANPRPGG